MAGARVGWHGEGELVITLESWEAARSSRGVEEGLSRSLSLQGKGDPTKACVQDIMFVSRGDRDLGVAFLMHPLASRVAQGVSGPSSSCVWNPRVFAEDPLEKGWATHSCILGFPWWLSGGGAL